LLLLLQFLFVAFLYTCTCARDSLFSSSYGEYCRCHYQRKASWIDVGDSQREIQLQPLQKCIRGTYLGSRYRLKSSTTEACGPLHDTVEPAPGVICTSPIQTYLDLAAAGERGREAADHLRREKLTWPK
jgi:hypothetical protein